MNPCFVSEYNTISYEFFEGADGLFAVNSATGVVTTTSFLQMTEDAKYLLYAVARDNDPVRRDVSV